MKLTEIYTGELKEIMEALFILSSVEVFLKEYVIIFKNSVISSEVEKSYNDSMLFFNTLANLPFEGVRSRGHSILY